MLSQFTIKYPVLKCRWTETSKHNTIAANIKWEREGGREGGRESIIHIHNSTIYSTCALLQYECMQALQQLLLMILAYKWPRDLLSWHPETWAYWQPYTSDFWVPYKNKQLLLEMTIVFTMSSKCVHGNTDSLVRDILLLSRLIFLPN